MISPLSLADFGWSSASLPSAGAVPDASESAASQDSFQNILAQAVTPQAVTSVSLAPPVPAPPAEASWTNAGATATSEGSSTAAPAGLAEHRDKIAGLSQISDRANAKSAARTLPQRMGAGKQESANRTIEPAEISPKSGASAAESGGNQTVPNQAEAAPSSASDSGSGKKSGLGTGSEQNGLPVAATTTLAGLKNLSGAAFAMHITPAGNQSNANPNSGESSSTAPDPAGSADSIIGDLLPSGSGIPAVNGAHAQPLPETSNGVSLPAAQLVSWASAAPAATLSDKPESAEAAPTTAEASEIEAEDHSGTPQPVHTVQLQLAGEGEGRVDLRLVEHAGGLSVSVRASDSALTRGLQENLPELSARLAEEKYQTHTFLPSASGTSGGNSSSGSSEQPSGQAREQSGGQSFSRGGSSSGGDGSGRQQEQATAWWRQMAALGKLSSSASTSGQGLQPNPAANPATNAQVVNT